MDSIRKRKLAYKSVLGFGNKYNESTVLQVISFKDGRSYLRWAYYNMSKIDFADEILDNELFIPEEFRIDKPGKDPDMFKKLKEFHFESVDKQKGIKKLILNNGFKGRKKKISDKAYRLDKNVESAGSLMGKNHGKK